MKLIGTFDMNEIALLIFIGVPMPSWQYCLRDYQQN